MAAGGAAVLGFPNIVKSQGVTSMRWQSTWPSKDIFHEFALDFAKKVVDMTGGDLKIEVLPAGAVVPAFQLLDAVSKGTLDGGHGVLSYHYGKQTALALWGSSPAYGMDANMVLAWHKYGGGKELLSKIYSALGANVVSFPYGPMPTQPLGWYKKPITKPDDFKGMKFRTVGISIDLFQGMGASVNALPGGEIVPALDRGLIEAAEFNNASSDRALGFHDVSKVCMLQSYHQNAETVRGPVQQDEIRCVAGQDEGDHRVRRRTRRRPICHGRRSTATRKTTLSCRPKSKVRFYRTPDSILQKQLEIFDQVEAKKSAENPDVQRSRRIAARLCRARGKVGSRHQRCPPHGLQSLFCQSLPLNQRSRKAKSLKRLVLHASHSAVTG